MQQRQCMVFAILLFFTGCLYSALRISRQEADLVTAQKDSTSTFEPATKNGLHPPSKQTEDRQGYSDDATTKPERPRAKDVLGSKRHPIQHLMADARQELEKTTKRQSKDLKGAVKEYRRRYGIPPPPHFDKWFEFAKSKNVQLIDEFDTIYNLITPFWGLKPKTIRARAKEALGGDNGLLGIAIRNHQVSHAEGGDDWMRHATQGMLEGFLQHLPDMDLAFNAYDEPRVIVPHDDLTRLLKKAKTETMPALNSAKRLTNDFSKTSPELSDKMMFEQVKHSRFNTFSKQATWTHSRVSCPPDSPARILDEDEQWDDNSQYGLSELGFVYNSTAMADICLSPSLNSTYGFFDRVTTYKVVHDLFPIFSPSKISTYNDIIYPSPWYWYNVVNYSQDEDKPWHEKHNKLYWRGSTTGGFSRDGSWRRQHRQNFVKMLNGGGKAKILNYQRGEGTSRWAVTEVSRAEYKDFMNVSFTYVGQCDEGDCKAQQEFFDIASSASQSEAWGYKYLLDMDGNAFSGRFLAFLRSMSMTFKFALFREWHEEWLKPWVHYVPLSFQGHDWLETVRFFNESSLGAGDAEKMALESRDWAAKTMRKEDMEIWVFRLLLEYARVIDDQRAVLGFDPSSAEARL